MGLPRRRRKQKNRFLDNLGGISPGTLGMFGIAVLLLLASAGIIAITVARRSSATTADAVPTAEPTAFVAIVETPFPTPITATVAPTPRTSASPRLAASPATPEVARTTTTIVSAGPIGSGQSKAARGVAGSMAVTLGGTLPPAQVAAAPSGGPANPIVGTNPTPTPLPTTVPLPTPTPTRPPVSTGGGSTGGGSTGGGNTIPPTATPRPPTATPTTAPPTATITPTPRPTLPPLPPVAFPGPGSATHSYALTYNQTTNLANVPSSDYAYIVLWSGFSKERIDGIKGALGLTAPVEATGDGYKVIDAAKGSLVVNNTLGSLRFTVPGQAGGPNVTALETPTLPVATTTLPIATTTPGPTSTAKPSAPASVAPSASPTAAATQTARPSAPSSAVPGAGTPTATPQVNDAAAIKRATDWLGQTGLLPDGIDAGRVTRPTTTVIIVTFHPTQPGASVLGDPAITVALGSDGAVREVNYRWPNSLNPRLATLRGATAAWADVAAGKGYLEVDQTIPANLAPNTVFKGTATVTKASIGWRLASADGTNYLVPVYIFEGMVVLDNPATTPGAAVPFRVYVQAAP